jgi:bacterioferritin-associated ferredoxin
MTRCECAGITFEEILRRVDEQGQPLEQVLRATGCGDLCTACLPDLHRFAARFQKRPPGAAAADPAPSSAAPAEPR